MGENRTHNLNDDRHWLNRQVKAQIPYDTIYSWNIIFQKTLHFALNPKILMRKDLRFYTTIIRNDNAGWQTLCTEMLHTKTCWLMASRMLMLYIGNILRFHTPIISIVMTCVMWYNCEVPRNYAPRDAYWWQAEC